MVVHQIGIAGLAAVNAVAQAGALLRERSGEILHAVDAARDIAAEHIDPSAATEDRLPAPRHIPGYGPVFQRATFAQVAIYTGTAYTVETLAVVQYAQTKLAEQACVRNGLQCADYVPEIVAVHGIAGAVPAVMADIEGLISLGSRGLRALERKVVVTVNAAERIPGCKSLALQQE